MNIAIYARVSSETQTRDGTIQSQLAALREYAKEHDLTIIAECLDDGYSGADLNRPGLDQLRDLAADRIVEGVLVLSPDRLSRKQAHQIILLEEFKKRNIQVIFNTQQVGDSPEDQLLLQIQGAIAEYERAQIIDRTRRGKKHAVKRGQVLGGNTPYGYKYVPKSTSAPGHWKIEPQEAEIVKLVFDWYVKKRMTGTAIAKRLEEEGYSPRTGRKWWSSTVYDILANEAYTGSAYMYKHKSVEPKKHPKLDRYRKRRKSAKAPRPRDQQIMVSVPQIIDQEIWEKAQKLLKQNAIRSKRNNRVNQYLLRGLVLCGECGSMAPGYVSNKKTYYSCGAKRNKNLTTKPHEENVSIRHPLLDQKVWQALVNLLDDPQSLQAQIEKRLQKHNIQIKQDTSAIDKLEKDLEKLAVQETRIIDAYREGAIDLDELKAQKAKIAKRWNSLEAQKEAALSQQEGSGQPEITMDMLGDLSARYRRVMGNADFTTREELTNLLINRVILHTDRAMVEGNIPVPQGDVLIPAHGRAPLR